jgi:hypothetical protein
MTDFDLFVSCVHQYCIAISLWRTPASSSRWSSRASCTTCTS